MIVHLHMTLCEYMRGLHFLEKELPENYCLRVSVLALGLRLGWPATDWETGPEPKMAEKWPAKMASDPQWGRVPKWQGK